ncbi:MAG TPA: helix-turn-helix domain-containing protein [Solirubrobacteraceae bacterium]|jgi:DNA-binding HxlR family transcriptional regulator|nr:helix-turn-helix domain-containing protein [Solirubrobacteraceae bacterium]
MAHAPSASTLQPAEPAHPDADLGDLEGLAEALGALGDRWSLAIVERLLEEPLRFGELQERMPAISPNVLSQRLRALQASGVVLASPYSEHPPRFLYELTSAGHELAGPLRLLADWGARRGGAAVEAPRHEACEAPLELRWYCPVCEQPAPAPGAAAEEQLYFA